MDAVLFGTVPGRDSRWGATPRLAADPVDTSRLQMNFSTQFPTPRSLLDRGKNEPKVSTPYGRAFVGMKEATLFKSGNQALVTRPPEGDSDFVNHEHLFEYFSRLFLSFFGKPDRLRFPNRIGDKTFFIEPIHCIPIKAFPNNAAMIKVEIEQSQNCVINAFLVEIQRWLLFLFHFRACACPKL
jgi:hypothetical protein